MICLTPPLSAGTLDELFSAATKSNQDYSVYKLALELAELKQTKGTIEAKVEQDRVQAKYEYATAVSTYWTNVSGFYNKVVDTVFDAGTADLSYQVCALNRQNAQEDLISADMRYKNGLISEDSYREIAIAFDTATTNLQLAEFTLGYSKSYVKLITGLDWNVSLLPDTPAFDAKASLDDWLKSDSTLEKARLNKTINDLKTDSLATNTSMYDRRIQDTENAKATVELGDAENNAKRSYESILSTLSNAAAVLKIRQDEYALKVTVYEQAQKQYEKGTLSLSSRNDRQGDVFTSQKQVLSARKDYIKVIASLQTAMRKNPLGL
jgi:outer membrane protein TolC